MDKLRYLCDSDFEMYGFKLNKNKKCSYGGKFFDLTKVVGFNSYEIFELNWIQHLIVVYKANDDGYGNSKNVIFEGYIDNKDELKVLFKMLKIN